MEPTDLKTISASKEETNVHVWLPALKDGSSAIFGANTGNLSTRIVKVSGVEYAVTNQAMDLQIEISFICWRF